jgi:hypothetical protein
MNNQFTSMGDYAINWNNVLYVKRTKMDNDGFAFAVYFSHQKEPLQFYPGAPEEKALLNWWQNTVRALPNGTEKASAFSMNR